MTAQPEIAIEFDHVSYRLAEGRELLSDLSLAIYRGEIFMLLGRSGSGKTTTLKLINRLLEPSSGEVRAGIEAGAPLADIEASFVAFERLFAELRRPALLPEYG